MQQIALVTGTNRGIGFEICRQLAKEGLKVILTSRDEKKGKAAAEKLKKERLDVHYHQLDVTSEESVEKCLKFVEKEFGKLDVLVNNAGIMIDPWTQNPEEGSALNAKLSTIKKTIETNTFGPFLMCQKFIPLMAKNKYGRVVNISSGMGQLSEMNGGWPAYRMSKTALNAVTRIFAEETKGKNVLVNSMCPGWVKTDMGGPNAERTPEQGADTAIFLATLPDNGPSGSFFRDRKQISW